MRRFLYFSAVLLVVAVIALAASGILYVEKTEDKVNITIDKQQLEQKTERAIEKSKEAGSELLDDTGKAFRRAGEKLEPSDPEPEAP